MRILYDQQIRIKRYKGAGNVRSYVATATADCSIQPLGKDRNQMQDGVFGQTYMAYVDEDTSVQVGDRVVDRNGVAYTVSQVVTREYGAFPYKELVIKKA